MKTCAFLAIGEIENPSLLRSKLFDIAVELINEDDVRIFFVGSGSEFDPIIYEVFDKIGEFYENLFCYVILPDENIPKELENKYSIDWACPTEVKKAPVDIALKVRDQWLKETADILILYGKKTNGLRVEKVIEI